MSSTSYNCVTICYDNVNGRPENPSNSRAEHYWRPRVSQLAPSLTDSAHAMGSGEDAGMWPAGAPATTREGAYAPQTEDVPPLGEVRACNIHINESFRLHSLAKRFTRMGVNKRLFG